MPEILSTVMSPGTLSKFLRSLVDRSQFKQGSRGFQSPLEGELPLKLLSIHQTDALPLGERLIFLLGWGQEREGDIGASSGEEGKILALPVVVLFLVGKAGVDCDFVYPMIHSTLLWQAFFAFSHFFLPPPAHLLSPFS